MRLYRHLSDFKASGRGVALAIGNFDGFHIGHQAVVRAMQQSAAAENLITAVMIFEPQPLEFFGRPVPRLSSLRDKLKYFAAAGVEAVFCLPFNQHLADASPVDFVRMLALKLKVKSITVGSLFTFGRGGKAGIDELKDLALSLGIRASAIDGVEPDGVRVSSTGIRAKLADGDFAAAQQDLGHPYMMSGRVIHGNALGRTIGFPTANLNLNRKVSPLNGVYAVKVKTLKSTFDGMANVGMRPTIHEAHPHGLIEVNIFNFNDDLYGQEIEVMFLAKIRDTRVFADLPSLMAQIKADRLAAASKLQSMQLFRFSSGCNQAAANFKQQVDLNG